MTYKKEKNLPEPNVKDPPMPPILDTYPPSMRIKIDPITNATIPTNEAVRDAKRWVDFNRK